jgi:hypothetical protein
MNTMKSSMTRMIAVTLIGCLALTAMASAGDWYTMTGGTFTTDGGYPWISDDTNYNYKIMQRFRSGCRRESGGYRSRHAGSDLR